MGYCHQCGSKVEDGSVFCTNCGVKLIEDLQEEEMQSHENQNFVPKDTFFNSQKETYSSYADFKNQVNFLNLRDILIKMLFKPVSAGKEFVENGEKSSVIGLTIFLAIVQGILGVWKVNQIISTIQSIALDLVQKISGIMNLIQPGSSGNVPSANDIMGLTTEINKVKSLINIPYGKIFLQNGMLFLGVIIVLFIVIYFGTSIVSKDKRDPFTIYKTALIISVPTLYFEVISILISYMSFYVGAGILLIGVIVSLASLSIIIREELFIDENHSVFIVAVSFLAAFIVVLMCLQKFLSSNISDIIMSVTNVMKNIKY